MVTRYRKPSRYRKPTIRWLQDIENHQDIETNHKMVTRYRKPTIRWLQDIENHHQNKATPKNDPAHFRYESYVSTITLLVSCSKNAFYTQFLKTRGLPKHGETCCRIGHSRE